MREKHGLSEVTHRMEVPNAILLGQVKEAVRAGQKAIINVKGYSMRPFLEHCRDKVLLAPIKDLKVGDAVLAEIAKDVYVLHRVVRIQADSITLMGDGNLKGVEHCDRKDVVGLVVCYYRNGKTLWASDIKMRKMVRLWCKLLPIRRYLLFVYKVNLKLSNLIHHENQRRF